jgi:hypothetical protein
MEIRRNSMKNRRLPDVLMIALLLLATLALLPACGSGVAGKDVKVTIHAQNTGTDDVAGFNFNITCVNGWHLTPNPTYVAVHGTTGSSHDFADLFATIPAPTQCTVTVTPMKDEKTPSVDCAPVTQQFDVLADKTVELTLMVQCAAPDSGGADITPTLNHPPYIIIAIPDKFPCVGVPAEIYVSASDPDGDTVTFTYVVGTWTVTGGVGACTPPPPSTNFTVTGAPGGYPWLFEGHVAGEFCMTVTAGDGHGGFAEMSFPIHVQDCKCCRYGKEPDFHFVYPVTEESCEHDPFNGVVVPDSDCMCCWDKETGTYHLLTNPAECREPDVIVPIELCREQGSHTWEANYTLDPDAQAVKSKYLVIPSTQAGWYNNGTGYSTHNWNDKMVVYDLDGANALKPHICPVNGITPDGIANFNVCNSPSRVMMDPYTDVITTCRGQREPYWNTYCQANPTEAWCITCAATPGDPTCNYCLHYPADSRCHDGHVEKYTKCGVKLWETQIPDCAATRGVVLSPSGRLFAACSNTQVGKPNAIGVYELNPVTGAIIDHVHVGYYLYGLAADANGIYFCSGYGHVGKVDYSGPALAAGWYVAHNCYGIGIDTQNRVWVSEYPTKMLDALDSSTGAQIPGMHTTITYSGTDYNGYGLTVGLDGRIYVGVDGVSRIAIFDPSTHALTFQALGPGIITGTADLGPHGVTLDTDGNLFTINQGSGTVTKLTPAGGGTFTATSFGGTDPAASWLPLLKGPYGYSGDMTGAVQQSITSSHDIWTSNCYDSGDPLTQWTNVTWTSTVPSGSSILLSYSLDCTGTWQPLASIPSFDPANGGKSLEIPPIGSLMYPAAQKIQFKADLSVFPPGSTSLPTIGTITVDYQ